MKLIYSDVFREIRKSFGRFISLLLIVLLGVAFYSGMRSTGPDMLITADKFYDEAKLADIRVISTLGLTDDDVREISKIEGVKECEGTYTADLFCKTGDSQIVVKLMAVQNGINEVILKSGNFPQTDSECLLDDYYMNMNGYEIGDKISFSSGDDTDISEKVKYTEFTVSGSFTSAAYLSFDKGTTSIGTGKLDGIVLVDRDAFAFDYYTEIDIICEDAPELLCYSDEYDDLVDEMMERIETIEDKRCAARYDELTREPLKEIEDAKAELKDAEAEIEDAKKELEDKKSELEKSREELAEGRSEFESQKEQYDTFTSSLGGVFAMLFQSQVTAMKEQLDSAEAELEKAEEQINEGAQKIKEAEAELRDAEEELEDNRVKIADAEEELAKIKYPEWYVLDRSYLQEYSSYRSDAKRISELGKVFPVVFFIVAALVCLTTMTRMVDEERTQIGTFKALGYSKGTIISKYLVYGLIATIIGSVAGVLLGGKILPNVIINVYKMLYPNLEGICTPYNLEHSLVASLAALACIEGATLGASFKSLSETPADLMRPEVPKVGKKLIIERIRPVWKKIPFTWKNALRNFTRYKKRLFMTLFGIIGSTALLMVGFGLKDAINTILYTQYGEIDLYNEILTIDNDAANEEIESLKKTLARDERISSYSLTFQTLKDASSKNSEETLGVYIMVPEDVDGIGDYIDLHERVDNVPITLSDEAVVISEKMARMLNVEKGDTVTISSDNSEFRDVIVGDIMENYIYHYVYMTPAFYEELYGEKPDYRSVVVVNDPDYAKTLDSSRDLNTEICEDYLAMDSVSGVSDIAALKDKFSDILTSFDAITLVLIICAGALTFIVLFNLNNINISERRRELATLKVLGFHDIELSQYIYRENVLITIIGIALGVLGGILLNSFVVKSVEVDIVMFGREIYFASYVKSILLAAVFAAIVNVIVHFKLKKIDMATSLKSVE